jgi:hypothetical protein
MLTAIETDRVQLTPKQANIYLWGWQPAAYRVSIAAHKPVFRTNVGHMGR